MKPIVIYSRVSTTNQNFESQIEDLKRWCKGNDFIVKMSFGEKVSGFNPDVERIEYDKMKDFVLSNNIKNIVIWEISRLSRSIDRTLTEVKFFTSKGVNIHFKKEGFNTISDNATDKILLALLSSMADFERDTIIGRLGRGRLSAILKGKMMHSVPPYGYIKDEQGMWSINKVEAKVIMTMFEMAAKGDTLYKICQHLNSLNIPTRQTIQGKKSTLYDGTEVEGKWNPTTIRRDLMKTIYKGIKTFQEHTISIPIIISPDLWDKVQKRFTDNIGHINKNKHPYLFKGMIRCGRCNRVLSTQTRVNDIGYYLCSKINDVTHKCENQGYINTHMIDDNLYSNLFNHQYIKEILSRDSLDALSLKEKSGQIEYFNSEINSLEGTTNRYKNLYATGYLVFEEMVKEVGKVTNQITDYKNRIEILNNDIQVISKTDIDDIILTYKNATDYNVKREFLTKYINNITLWNVDLANVNWRVPLQKNEKMIYIEMKAFNYNIPIKILLTPYSKNVIVTKTLEFLKDYNMVVDTSKKLSV